MGKAVLHDLAQDPSETRDVKQGQLLEYIKLDMEEWRQSVIWIANEEVKCVGNSISPHAP